MQMKLCHHLAELLTSRLCHDLITPISAINTGLELFQETTSDLHTESEEILQLVLNSAQTAAARVSYYRVAFGSSGTKICFNHAQDLIKKYFIRSKLHIQWKNDLQENLVLDKWGRILLNCVLWMSECAPRGGELQISMPKPDLSLLSLRLKTESIIVHQGTLEALEGKTPLEDITPRTVPCYLIYSIVRSENGKIIIKQNLTHSDLLLEIDLRNN